MTQYLDVGLRQPQDLRMMNNNYLPGIPNLQNAVRAQQSSQVSSLAQGDRTGMAGFHSSVQNGSFPGAPSGNLISGVNVQSLLQQNDAAPALVDGNSFSASSSSQPSDSILETQGDLVIPCTCAISSNNFTFTTPTQSHLYSPTSTVTTPNRMQFSRVTPQTFAPTGCSAQWQHSIPQRRPWFSQTRIVSQPGICGFTGTVSSAISNHSSALSQNSHQMSQPVPSCSKEIKRPKRPHGQEPEELSPTAKIHLTQEKLEKHMKELRLHNCSPPNVCNVPVQIPASFEDSVLQAASQENLLNSYQAENLPIPSNLVPYPLNTQQQWENFQQLENRLEMEEEESNIEQDQPENFLSQKLQTDSSILQKLHILGDIPAVVDSQPVLPKEVMENIVNPCRQLIIWNPPESLKPVVSPGCVSDIDEDSESQEESRDSMMEAGNSLNSLSAPMISDMMDGVETEDTEEMLDL